MSARNGKNEYHGSLTDISAMDDDFSLEEILAEYGSSRGQKILRDAELTSGASEKTAAPASETPEKASGSSMPKAEEARQEARDKLLAQAVDLEKLEKELPRAPRPISLEEVVGSTVEAVMDEQQEPLLQPKRGLFSRRKLEETEQLYAEPEAEPEPEPIGPEKPLLEAAADYRERSRRKGCLLLGLLVALVPIGLAVAERFGLIIPLWTADIRFQSIIVLTCLALTAVLCRAVFGKGLSMLRKKRCVSEFLLSLSVLAAAADCVVCLISGQRSAVPPYGAASCLALVFAQWGISRESRGMYDMFHAAAMDDRPPYLVTDTERGACKQQGAVSGFYTTAMGDNAAVRWQTILLPLVLVASIVFAGLGSLGEGKESDFFLHWSVILSAGSTFGLPLCWGLPWSRLARHLQKTGCAVAGWVGAEKISRRKSMILTDADLFPPGTIQLNGVKVYGEEMKKVAAYGATMARCAGSGLERLFDGFLRGEGARYEKAHDFSFFEEGGWSATIHGESVLMGTTSFMRKMEVRIPGDINLKTGVFLAIDRQLTAVFAVKYNPAENVDFALRMMRRSHITPILAARDPNITPALLKRKFYKGVKVEYPSLTSRVALSEAEHDRDLPRALLFREGLLPYAETVAGSRRLCRAVRQSTAFSLFGSAVGTLLTAYLVSLEAYSLLTPLTLVLFLLLWVLPVLLMTDWPNRY